LCNDIQVVFIKLALHDFAEIHCLHLIPILTRLVAEELYSGHWLSGTTRVVLSDITVGSAGNQREVVAPAEVAQTGVKDWNFKVELVVGQVFSHPEWLLSSFIDIPDLKQLVFRSHRNHVLFMWVPCNAMHLLTKSLEEIIRLRWLAQEHNICVIVYDQMLK